MKINEIFKSISGEAARAGFPVIFIRTYGCNLRCTYCDSMYALEGGDYKVMTPEQIVAECYNYGVKRVVFTGGEPLLQPDAPELVDLLCNNGYEVEIETNGAVDLQEFHKKLTTKRNDLLSYTMDFKSIASGMSHKMLTNNLEFLTAKDVVKFVVGCQQDLEQMKAILDSCKVCAQVFVSPIFGQIEPADIVKFVLDNNLHNVRTQLQIHKIIWDKDKRGV